MRDTGRVEKKQGKEAALERPLVKTMQQADKPSFPSKARGGKRLPRIEREQREEWGERWYSCEMRRHGRSSLGRPTSSCIACLVGPSQINEKKGVTF